MELKEVYLSVLSGLVGTRAAAPENIAREAMRIALAAMREWERDEN